MVCRERGQVSERIHRQGDGEVGKHMEADAKIQTDQNTETDKLIDGGTNRQTKTDRQTDRPDK
jgi:hypothetical protein